MKGGLSGPARRICAAVALSLAATSLAAQEMTACAAHEGFPNPQLLATMQRGVNLPGWDHADAQRRPTPAQLRAVREAGLTHIRLLIDERRLEDGGANAYLDDLFEQVVLLLSLDFTVSLDLHAGGETGRRFGTDRQGAIDHLSALWRSIAGVANRFEPAQVAVELLNEPEFGQDDWMAIAGALRDEVRELLPDHTIVIGPSGPQRHETLAGMEPFADRNIVYAVHYYDPFPFTHQGANWGGPDDPVQHLSGLPFPAERSSPAIADNIARLEATGLAEAADLLRRTTERPWDEASVASAYDMMAGWSARHHAPVIVNEFGVLDFVAPRASRLRWLETTARLAEERCIGWTHWDFQDGFGLIDHDTGLPDPEIMRALLPGG